MNVPVVVKNSVIPKYENIQTTHRYKKKKKNQSHNGTDDHNFFFYKDGHLKRCLKYMFKVNHIYLQIYEVTA